MGDRARRELEVDERDVRDVRDHAAAAERADVTRRLTEPVAQDREVVRAEVPGDADIGLVQAEIHAARRDEVDLAELVGGERLLQEGHGARNDQPARSRLVPIRLHVPIGIRRLASPSRSKT